MSAKVGTLLKFRRSVLALMFGILSMAVIAGCSSSGDITPHKVVTTDSGSVRGIAHDANTWEWLGIPYAKPPVGDLRWRAPQDPDPWTDVRDASTHCSECTQQNYDATWHTPSNPIDVVGSEDCLYLDVYAPRPDETGLPVYVWLHGGSNNFGSAQQYDGAALADRGNMVVVVVQYRLNVLGWFTNAALRDNVDQADASGNYGALDQIKALQWVHDNIAAFGGDPARVTVGGESAGAHDTLNLIMSPLAAGLFSQAVVESAAMDPYTPTGTYGDVQSNNMIDWLLVHDGTAADMTAADTYRSGMTNGEIETYLRSQNTTDLIQACIVANGGTMPNHSAYIDGYVLPDDAPATPSAYWPDIIASGTYNHVPILIGSNHDEWKPFQPLYGGALKAAGALVPSDSNYSWGDLFSVLDGDLTLDQVLPSQEDKDFYTETASLSSRLWKATYVDTIADTLTAVDSETPVYAYRFDWQGGDDPALANFQFILGAGHSFEIPFFFGEDSDAAGYSFTAANAPGRTDLQNDMMSYLTTFINTGDPNPAGSTLTEWPQWASGAPDFIVFNADDSQAQLTTSNQEESYTAIFTDIAAARAAANPYELVFMNTFGLVVP